MESSTPSGEALEKVSAAMTVSELRAAALASMRSRTAAPLDVGSGASEATVVYQVESTTQQPEQGELVDYTDIAMGSSLAACVNMGASALSKPDDDFDALLLEYQNSTGGPTATPEHTMNAANSYGEMADRSSYYDYDSGQMIYGVDRYSSQEPALMFGGANAGYADRSAGYTYQGAQWPIPGLSYFPGSHSSQHHTQSTFSMLNQYHMQLRMLMSPSPRPAEPLVPERYGQPIYSLPPPPIPTMSQPFQLPPFSDYGGFAAAADSTTNRPVGSRPVIDDGLLSDGELESVSGDLGHTYIGKDSDATAATAAVAAAGVGGMGPTSLHDAHQDVEGIVKERIGQMLKMKNPQLLQGSSFRALMLLLKCIRLDDPDVIYVAVKSAPTQVVSELNVLSAEFALDMITEACVATLLATDAKTLHANFKLRATEAVAVTGVGAEAEAASSAEHSDGVDMDTRPPSDENESSTPDSDMDTSSDVDYEYQPSSPRQPALDSQSANPRSSAQPMPPLSRETTPQFRARFSRSRAPSPPSAQPRTPRRLSYARKSPTPSDHESRGLAHIGSSILSMHSSLSIRNSRLLNGADQSWRVQSPPLPSREIPEPAQPVAESTVCASESGQLVVYLDHSNTSSDDSSSTSSECDNDSDDDRAQSARDRACRLENRMINKECRRLAQEEDQLASQSLDSSARPSAASSTAALSASRVSTPADSAKISNEALLKAQENIRAQEVAIARIKMEINRKQTKMLLRKKLHESKLKRAHAVASSATAPTTPHGEMDSPDMSTVDSPALHGSASSQSLSSASDSNASNTQPCRVSEDAGQLVVSAPCSPARKESDQALAGPSSDVGGDTVTSLPECGPCEQMIQRVSPEIRSVFLSNIMALLKGATQSKNSELRSIMRGTSMLAQKDFEKLKLSASQLDERLLARQARLKEQRDDVSKRISTLHAELDLVDMELGILSYSQAANRGYSAALRPKASSSHGNATSTATTSGSRAAVLRNEIAAVHQFMDSMFRVADTSAETTASDNDLAVQTSKMALEPGSLPPAATSGQLSAPPRPQRELGALRAKLVAMKQEQASMSLKLANLAEKRKGAESGQSALPSVKRPRAGSCLHATPPVSASDLPRMTSIAQLLDALQRNAAKHGNSSSLNWNELPCLPADDCIIRQLFIVDGIGMSCITDLGQNLFSGSTPSNSTDTCRAPDSDQTITGGVIATHDAVTPAYVPYDSPLSASARTRTSLGNRSAMAGLSRQSQVDESVDLSDVTSDSLYALVDMWPSTNPRMAPQYYADMNQALRRVEPGHDGTAPNETIAWALLPVVSRYQRMIPSIYLSVSRSLGRALGLNVENPAKYKGKTSFTSFAGSAESEVLQIDDITNLRRSVSEMAGFIPILNRDVARMTYSLLAAQLQSRQQQPHSASALPLRRYYDASESRSAITPGPASGGDDGNDDKPGLYAGSAGNPDPRANNTCSAGVGNDNETDAANANDGPDARYRRALHLLWHGYPVSGAVINESHILKYLHSAANKSVGNALVSLKQSLQLYPRSERLWDLYLELFARQPVPAQEVIAAFHDATKFNPGSTFLWQRYMHWCNWNIVHGVNSLGDCSLWLSRLSTLSLAAVKGHVDMQQYPLAEQASASLAKIIVCFWEGLWTLLGLHITWSSRSGVVLKPAVLKAQLISQMVACLWARTPAELCNLLSDAGASGVSHDLSSSTGQSSLDCSELALGRLLLPHHFLYVGQVFLHCFIAGSFVPQSVLAQMHTTLSTDPRRPITTHRLSLRKITQLLPAARELDGSLKPHISGVIRRFYTSIQAILGSYSLAESADLQNSAVARSLAICHASMNLTLAELEQCPPAKTLTLTHGREDLLYRISKDPLDSLDIKGLPEQIVGQGIDTFAMVTRIMSKCDLAHNNYVSCEVAVHILREHALLVAKKLGVAPSTSMPTPWPVSNVMSTPNVIKRLRRRIADCRILYYRILGHTGPEQPKSMDALGLGLVNIPRDESVNYSRLLANAGIWINVAMIEFLVARFSSSSLSVSVDVQAIDSALFWLNYGLKTHVVDSGARAQLQAIILQVTTVKRPLSVKDIVRVHRDLGYADNSDTLHLLRMNLAPINAVLRPLLLTASSETLEAIRGYLHYVGYANTELALRLIAHASMPGKSAFGLRGLLQQVQRHNASDPLVVEM